MIPAALLAAALGLDPGVRLTALGDSLALGVGAADSSRGFAFDIYERVRDGHPRSEITNLAIGGATTADVLRLEVPRLGATRPDIVLVEAGANDAIHRHPPAAFAAEYRALVERIVRVAPRARVVLFNVPDVSVSPIFEAAAKAPLHRLALAYNETVAAEGKSVRASVVDLFAFSERARSDPARYLSADRFHPSDDGHAAIAEAAWPVVRAAVTSLLTAAPGPPPGSAQGGTRRDPHR